MEKDKAISEVASIIEGYKDVLSLTANSLALFTQIYDQILNDKDDSYSELRKKVEEHRNALLNRLMKELKRS